MEGRVESADVPAFFAPAAAHADAAVGLQVERLDRTDRGGRTVWRNHGEIERAPPRLHEHVLGIDEQAARPKHVAKIEEPHGVLRAMILCGIGAVCWKL